MIFQFKPTFDRFVVGDENELAHQHALNIANDAKRKVFITVQ